MVSFHFPDIYISAHLFLIIAVYLLQYIQYIYIMMQCIFY